MALALVAYMAWAIWSREPGPRSIPEEPPAQASPDKPDKTVQTLERFEFTSTLSGKRDYTISADHLRGIEGGVHTLDGIRSVEILRPDGKSLKGSADHGTFKEAPQTAAGKTKGRLVLEGRVRIQGPEGDRLESERVEFSQTEAKLISPGKTRFTQGNASGEAGRIEYDLGEKTLRAGAGITLRLASAGEPDTILRAKSAEVRADGSSADLTGDVTLTRGDDFLSGPVLHLERSAEKAGEIRFVMGAPARGRIASPGLPAPAIRARGGEPERPVLLAADRIEGQESGGAGGVRTLTLHGAASIQDEEAKDAPLPRSIRADQIVLVEEGGGHRRKLIAEGAVTAVLPSPLASAAEGGGARTLSCRRLEALGAPGGSIERADADGEVRIVTEGRTATAAHARFFGDNRIELRGDRPRAAEGERTLIADEIDVLSNEGRLTARGAVRARFVPDSGADQTLFGRGGPVEISSDAAVFERDSQSGEFTGAVVARQGERALSAKSLLLNDAERSAKAEGSVILRTFREEENTAAKPPTPGAASPVATGSAENARGSAAAEAGGPLIKTPAKVPVQIDADAMFHEGRTEETRFSGHAVYREPGRRLSADLLRTVGGLERAGRGEAIGEGNVVFEGEGKRAHCDLARYIAADHSVLLQGKETPAEVMELATARLWRGPSLTWVLVPDSIPTVPGESGRSRVIAAGSSPGRVPVGKQTDGRRPR